MADNSSTSRKRIKGTTWFRSCLKESSELMNNVFKVPKLDSSFETTENPPNYTFADEVDTVNFCGVPNISDNYSQCSVTSISSYESLKE